MFEVIPWKRSHLRVTESYAQAWLERAAEELIKDTRQNGSHRDVVGLRRALFALKLARRERRFVNEDR